MLEQIIDIVRRAGDIVLSAHDIQNVTREKHGPADLVTQYDEAVQAFLRQELLKLLPEAEFFGEEGERPALTHPWIFVVDPIDGTTNFTRRMNCSSVSVALVHNGQAEYGVVITPLWASCSPLKGAAGPPSTARPSAPAPETPPTPLWPAAPPSMTAAIPTGTLPSCGTCMTGAWTTGGLPQRPWTAAWWPAAGRRSSSSADCLPGTMPPGL